MCTREYRCVSELTGTSSTPDHGAVATVLQLFFPLKLGGISLPTASSLLLFSISLSCFPRQLEGCGVFNFAIIKSFTHLTKFEIPSQINFPRGLTKTGGDCSPFETAEKTGSDDVQG